MDLSWWYVDAYPFLGEMAWADKDDQMHSNLFLGVRVALIHDFPHCFYPNLMCSIDPTTASPRSPAKVHVRQLPTGDREASYHPLIVRRIRIPSIHRVLILLSYSVVPPQLVSLIKVSVHTLYNMDLAHFVALSATRDEEIRSIACSLHHGWRSTHLFDCRKGAEEITPKCGSWARIRRDRYVSR